MPPLGDGPLSREDGLSVLLSPSSLTFGLQGSLRTPNYLQRIANQLALVFISIFYGMEKTYAADGESVKVPTRRIKMEPVLNNLHSLMFRRNAIIN